MATELQQAIEFFDRVQASPLDERIAVGQDHWNWLLKAARAAADHISLDGEFDLALRDLVAAHVAHKAASEIASSTEPHGMNGETDLAVVLRSDWHKAQLAVEIAHARIASCGARLAELAMQREITGEPR